MKVLDSFIVNTRKERFVVQLIQKDVSFLLKHVYFIDYKKDNPFDRWYLTKFFAKRKYNQIKNGYKLCWLEYSIYEVGRSNAK